MVMPYPERRPDPDRMVRSFFGDPAVAVPSAASAGVSIADLAPPPWRIEMRAADGSMLLVLREENGQLVAEYDDARVNEAARALLVEMMRWAGGAGINWKSEVQQ